MIHLWQTSTSMSLDEIRTVLAGTTTDATWRTAVGNRAARCEEQISHITATRAALLDLLQYPSDDPSVHTLRDLHLPRPDRRRLPRHGDNADCAADAGRLSRPRPQRCRQDDAAQDRHRPDASSRRGGAHRWGADGGIPQ